MAISDRTDLHEHLEWAMAIELLTIPPYLYALYSIKDRDAVSAKLIRSIVAEEMLHLALAANVLLAVGGNPRFYDSNFAPSYPLRIPHHTPELIVNLEPCSPHVVEHVFMPIEQPKDLVSNMPDDGEYHSLGDFYMEIESSIHTLCTDDELFVDPQLERQLADSSFYAPVEFDAEDSGGLHGVVDEESAKRAIETIIHQGEGLRDHHWADSSHQELTHYYKLREIAEGRAPIGEVWPLEVNPTLAMMKPDVAAVARLFNAAYSLCLVTLDELYAGVGEGERRDLVGRLYAVMARVMPPVAHVLVNLPGVEPGKNAGPTFEFHAFADPAKALAEVQDLAWLAADANVGLDGLPEAIGNL